MNGEQRSETGYPEYAQLVREARAGDVRAFRSLYDAHFERVHGLSLRLMTDRTEAEELTQDVFIAAWRNLKSFRGESSVSTWLHGIAVRLARQRLRTAWRRRAREERYATSYTEALTQAMRTPDLPLERALALLPSRMRIALVLHAIEGYTQARTAEMMGISENTVKAHVHQARALLQERLDRHG